MQIIILYHSTFEINYNYIYVNNLQKINNTMISYVIYEEKYKMYTRKIMMLISMAMSFSIHMGMMQEVGAPGQQVIGEKMGPEDSTSTAPQQYPPDVKPQSGRWCGCFGRSAPKSDNSPSINNVPKTGLAPNNQKKS